MDWITPMEPISSSSIPSGEEWIFQIKWDGIRGLTYYQRRQGEDHVRIFTKSGRERTEYYPELHHIGNLVAGNNAVLDGEMVVPDNDGKPSFHLSLIREKTGRKDKLPHYIRKYPVIYIVFDILYLNDCLLTELPLKERRNILYQSLNQDGNIAITEDFEDGPGLYDLMKRKGWEGIVSKKKNSLYCPAKNHSEWFKLETTEWSDKDFILLNNLSTLVWLGNQAALELHTGFHRIEEKICPTDLVFDLDPSEGQFFNEAAETALLINETLIKLSIRSWVKTSGATGLQIYIPTGSRYDYETARKINRFFGYYFSQKYPERVTIERKVKNRGTRLYFDYLQMWEGKTITMVYSPRANQNANVSMPVTWEELEKGIHPDDFNLLNAAERLEEKGDLFMALLEEEHVQNLDFLLEHIEKNDI